MSPKPTYEELEQKIEDLELIAIQRIELNEKLRKSDELFEKTFISQRDAIFILDSEIPPKIIDCNPAAERTFGYTRQEMLERPTFFLHINEPTLDKFQANLYPSVEDRGYYYLSEFEMMKKDGNIFATENTVFPLQDERGIRIGWVSVIRDITKRKFANEALQKAHDELERRVEERTAELVTSNEMLNQEVAERKQAEEALREDSEQLQKLSEASFDGVVIMEKGVIQEANQTFADLYGYELSEIIGMDALDFISPESKDIVLNKIIAGYEKRYEATVQKKEGKKFEVEACGAAITYKGRPARITAMRDITKRKQAEEALKESELKHKTLVHNIPGMVYRGYTDWSAEIISGSEEICGYTNKELNSEKESWLSIIHPDDKAKVFMKGSELAKRKQNIVQTYRIVTKGGDNRWVEDWKTSLFTEEGEFIGIDGIVFDITERKRFEEELLKIHFELEQRVEERTRELEVQKNSLEEINIAMKVLLKKREEDKIELQDNILSNVKILIEPYVKKLKGYSLPQGQKTLINILESNLNEIVSPFARKLSSKLLNLTPSEIQVANLVKQGETTKEMAGILNISGKTVGFHRENIRKKLGLKKKKANLRSHLLSLQ